MGLEEEIRDKRAGVQTDAYTMALGELIHLYQESRLDLHPKFQRFFRWNDAQKSALIESILVGIPLPPIFVAQRPDGIWEVIDGLQRLSTIFQLVGVLRNENGDRVSPLVLQSTKYLPSLQDKRWNDSETQETLLTPRQKFEIERTKIDVKIIQDQLSKYDVFLRLNSGGTPLSPQEIRNCIMLMENPDIYERLDQMRRDENFISCVSLSEPALAEQSDSELVLRFVVFRTMDLDELKGVRDLTSFLNDRLLWLASARDFDWESESQAFGETFEILASGPRDNSFKRFSSEKARFEGGLLNAAFETVALGVGHHHAYLYDRFRKGCPIDVEGMIKNLWRNDEHRKALQSAGLPAASRIAKSLKLGRDLFGVNADGNQESVPPE